MPSAPPRPCPRCGTLVFGRCPRCTQASDRARGTATARGYDQLWADLAREFLRKFPWCGQRVDGKRYGLDSECAALGERVRAEVVDHIVPLRAGGPRLDPMNFQSLCTRCNLRKAHRQNAEARGDPD